jgi:hypothetical protein
MKENNNKKNQVVLKIFLTLTLCNQYETISWPGTVARACNPSYLGGYRQEDHGPTPQEKLETLPEK